jgi:hypothetical protein
MAAGRSYPMESSNFNQVIAVRPGAGMSLPLTDRPSYYLDAAKLVHRLLRGRKVNSQPARRAASPAPWYRQFDRR